MTFLSILLLVGCSTSKQQEQKPQKQEKAPASKKGADKKAPADKKMADKKKPGGKDEKPGAARPEIPVSGSFRKFTKQEAREKIRNEQTLFLFKSYLTSAKNYASQGKYSDAYHFIIESLKLQPDHEESLQLKKLYGSKLGLRPEEISDRMSEAEQAVLVKIEQAKVEIDNRIAKGKRLQRQKQYDQAIAFFKQAKEILRWMPYHVIDLEGKSRQLNFLIEQTEKENRKYKEEQKRQRLAAAEEQAKREEEARLRTMQDQIRTLFREANLAFERERYDLAESFCQRVVVLDPDNKKAQELVNLIRAARHAKIFETSKDRYLEEWKKIFEQIDLAMVPMHEIVRFPSYETWKKIASRGSKGAKIEEAQESPQDRKIRERLASEVLSMDFTEAPLSEVVDFLRTTTGINIIIDPQVYKDFPEEEALKVDMAVNKLKISSILNLMLSLKGLDYKIANGVLIISTKKRITEKPVLRLYNVRDLTGKLNDFPGQDISLTAPAGGQQGGGGIKISTEEPRSATTITEEQLTDLIKNNIAKGTWDTESRSIDTRHGTLIIRQTGSVHKQIDALLNDLRKATGLLVTIETRFLTVTDDFLEDVGVDWRGLGASPNGNAETNAGELPVGDVGTGYDFRQMDDVVFGSPDSGDTVGNNKASGLYYRYNDDLATKQRLENLFDQSLGNPGEFTNTGGLAMQMAYVDDVELQMILQAVRKRSRSNVLTAPRLTVFNTQRANVTVVNQIAYVQDYDVEIATNSTIADPVIGTVQDGVVLDVRPIISADRKYVTLELQPTVAVLQGGAPEQRTTQLASSASNGPGSVVIELPNLSMTKIKTTVTIPDGGTLLLGGLIEAERQDMMSGIPVISDLPIFNFFMSRRGKYAHRQNLLILVTASITTMEEKEPNEGKQQ